MRLLDTENDKALCDIKIYLTRAEAQELLDDLIALLKTDKKAYHVHINDVQYKHEITVALYDEKDISTFNDRSKKLIKFDK